MIAEPRWKTLAVQFLIWSSLLPFHKDTRVLPWLQTCLCYSDWLGFHRKDGRIEPFHRAQIIKHNFSLICLKNVLRLKLTTVLYLLGGIIALSRGHWGKPVEVLHLTGVPLDGQPLPCSKETGREKERGGGADEGAADWKSSSASWKFAGHQCSSTPRRSRMAVWSECSEQRRTDLC